MTASHSAAEALVRNAYSLITSSDDGEIWKRANDMVREACALDDPGGWRFSMVMAALGIGQKRDLAAAYTSLEQLAALNDKQAAAQIKVLTADGPFAPEAWLTPPAALQQHAEPRIITIKGLLSPTVCTWLMRRALPRLTPSLVKMSDGTSVADTVRTSHNASLTVLEPDLVVQLTRLRLAAVIGLPVEHQEGTMVLRYRSGQEYKHHFDFITPNEEHVFEKELRILGQRAATLLVYLNEDYGGGETIFPRLDWRYRGNTGDALLFWNLSEAGEREPKSLHAGMPVTHGEKWLLSQWVRERPVPLRVWGTND